MFKHILPILAVIFFFSCAEQSAQNAEETNPDKPLTDTVSLLSASDQVAYVLGANAGLGLRREAFTEVDVNEFLKGVSVAIKNESTERMNKETPNALVAEYINKKAQFDKVAKKADLSYAYGYTMGLGYAFYGDVSTIDLEKYKKGMQHGMFENKLQLDFRQANSFLNTYKMEREKYVGAEWLEKNKNNADVVVLASGLQYKVVKMGKGAKPKETDNVKVHYRGTLIDGKEFDSSFKRNEPASFALNQVIKGWTEGLQLMPVGSVFQFYIPYQLAYGDQATNGIPAFSTLIFDVELLAINK